MLKDIVDELMILNDDNLAQRVIDNNDVQWCLSELQDMLAADVAPVVHGRWEWADDGYCRCSECRQRAPVVYGALIEDYQDEPQTVMTYFCPHCGAMMDGGDSDVAD